MSGMPRGEIQPRTEFAASAAGAALASLSDRTPAPPQALPPRWRAAPVDDLCDEFESLWRAGGRPRIEDFLARAGPDAQGELLSQLVGVEVHWRRQRNEQPSPEEYVQRFPLGAGVVERRFAGRAAPLAPLVRRTGLTRCEACGAQELTVLGCLGQYQLLAELGRGGMGVVYKARQCSADRLVALKVIRSDCFHSSNAESQAEILERFQHEARAAARLQHENIVTIYEVGEVDGRPFFSMQYVAGATLADALREGPLEARRAATYVGAVARGVHEAHQHGILHRDLKPQNIVVEQATDVPRVMDFGLAKLRGGEEQLTQAGQLIGTPAYMAPEQAANAADVGPEADIYSLGATLYALLTGRPPFQAATPWETLRQVLSSEPVSPAQLNRAVDHDLETICLKCLHKEPARRYPSAAAMADDLARFLRREPISARPVGRVEHTLRWCRRNPLVANSAALAVLCLVFGVTALSISYVRRSLALEELRQLNARAEPNVAEARHAVDDLFTRVSEERLLNQPGLQPVRRDLLLRARDHYERILRQNDTDLVRDDLAIAHFRVGLITEQIESPAKALPALEAACRLQERLLDLEPHNVMRLRALGDTLNALGRCRHKQRQFEPALECYAAAVAVRRQLIAEEPDNVESQRTLANTYMNIGLLEKETDPAQGRQSLEKAQALRQEARTRAGDDPKLRRDLAIGHYNLAKLAEATEDYAAAEAALQQASELFEELYQQDRGDLEAGYQVAVCHRTQGDLLATQGRPADALRWYARARKAMEPLAIQNPRVVEYQLLLAELWINTAQAEYEAGRVAAAVAAFENSAALLQPLLTTCAEDPRFSHNLLVTLQALAVGHEDEAQRAAALRGLADWERQLQALVRSQPAASDLRERLERVRAAIAESTAATVPPESNAKPAEAHP
jgi:serine/threonine-protein kinase